MEVETPTKSETTLLANEEMAFALEPVAATRRHNQATHTVFLPVTNLLYIMQTFNEALPQEWESPP